jgi:hypothetical protein
MNDSALIHPALEHRASVRTRKGRVGTLKLRMIPSEKWFARGHANQIEPLFSALLNQRAKGFAPETANG